MDATTALESFKEPPRSFAEYGMPFYAEWMDCQAPGLRSENVRAFVDHAARVPRSVVRDFLIDGGWRPLVMAAWYSLAFDVEDVWIELAFGMGLSRGSLSGPAVMTAATVMLGEDAMPMLVDYSERISDGSERFAAACARSLGYSTRIQADSQGIDAAQRMLPFAQSLRVAIREGRA